MSKKKRREFAPRCCVKLCRVLRGAAVTIRIETTKGPEHLPFCTGHLKTAVGVLKSLMKLTTT